MDNNEEEFQKLKEQELLRLRVQDEAKAEHNSGKHILTFVLAAIALVLYTLSQGALR